MAIAFVNSAIVSSPTGSYTVSSGQNRLLMVDATSSPVGQVTAITYGGVSMTKIAGLDSNVRSITLWYLLNPPSGSNAFNITGGNFTAAFVSDFTGVLQTGQPDASGTNTGASVTSIAKTLTTVADNCWLIGASLFTQQGTTETAQANTTIRQGDLAVTAYFDSNGPQTPPGSHTLGVDYDATANNAYIIVASFSPSLGTIAVNKSYSFFM